METEKTVSEIDERVAEKHQQKAARAIKNCRRSRNANLR
jgi:hypothetical protein